MSYPDFRVAKEGLAPEPWPIVATPVTREDIQRALDTGIMQEVESAAKARQQVIDRLCEEALQGGVCGVSVYGLMAMVDPEVPYGYIYHHQRARPEGESNSMTVCSMCKTAGSCSGCGTCEWCGWNVEQGRTLNITACCAVMVAAWEHKLNQDHEGESDS
jgi:hypothetical protein